MAYRRRARSPGWRPPRQARGSPYGDRGLDARVGVVPRQCEVGFDEVVDSLAVRVDQEPGECPWRSGQLKPRLVEVVEIEVGVAQGVDQVAGLELTDLGDHHRQQRVGRDVRSETEEYVGRALVELAGESAVGNVELEHRVARLQGHVLEVGDVPGTDHMPA